MTLTILAKFLTNRTTIAIGRLDLVDASKFVNLRHFGHIQMPHSIKKTNRSDQVSLKKFVFSSLSSNNNKLSKYE